MTTTVTLSINKYCNHKVSVRLIAHDGRVLNWHNCAEGNVSEQCEFTLYEGVQLQVREGDFPASNALAEIVELRTKLADAEKRANLEQQLAEQCEKQAARISELEHELAALKVPVELNVAGDDVPAPKTRGKSK